ncbi:pyridoxamine 5'-phosphate oxidase family protein [Streptomyces syringium]|uniref:pyridoxamine 5'-phosphate oxidase family protein n=1 Tax=Streptomyces syringium TaxID=76729 RepID=UPI003660F379
MTNMPPARSAEQRKSDVLERLEKDQDAWVSTADRDGGPLLAPLSFVWHDGTLLMCTRTTNRTARNLAANGEARIALGHTRDVILIDAAAETVAGTDLPAAAADAFAAKLAWDPRERAAWVYLRFRPRRLLAWREENELEGRELMRNGAWRV